MFVIPSAARDLLFSGRRRQMLYEHAFAFAFAFRFGSRCHPDRAVVASAAATRDLSSIGFRQGTASAVPLGAITNCGFSC
jgi:hypothetical protein